MLSFQLMLIYVGLVIVGSAREESWPIRTASQAPGILDVPPARTCTESAVRKSIFARTLGLDSVCGYVTSDARKLD